MEQKKKTVICVGCLCLSILLLALGLATLFIGDAAPFVDCFAVDRNGNVYVSTGEQIQVYADGNYLYTFADWDCFAEISMKDALFTIDRGNIFLLVTESGLYRMDLHGNLLEKTAYSPTLYNRISAQKRSFTSASGDQYTLINCLGRTRIVKNDSQTVYVLPFTGYAVKLAFTWAAIALLFAAVTFFIPLRKRRKRRKPPINFAGQL